MSEALAPRDVQQTLDRHLIADGFPLVFDLHRSHGSRVVDAGSSRELVDMYGFFASLPLGFNHPAFARPEARERLLAAAIHKPANSDANTLELAAFVAAFGERAMPAPFRHLFFIDGGALAVENALKAAFDWKVRRNLAAGRGELGSKVVHFREAFHGRTGYTMSLTNTQPIKVAYFPKLDWPRVHNPKLRFPIDAAEIARVSASEQQAIAEIEQAFAADPHDIAAIIIEPIQGEGGDSHFRGEFLRALRQLADRHDALLIFDEIQTGFGGTGRLWCWQHFDVVPDIVAFGKKAQVCGIMAGPRLDEVEDNVFQVSSRINSTWGGNLVDMVRCQIVLEVFEQDGVIESAAKTGEYLLEKLHGLASASAGEITQVRGRGLMCAFDLPDGARRDVVLAKARRHGVLVLPCGAQTIRFRPALTITREDIDEGLARLAAACSDR